MAVHVRHEIELKLSRAVENIAFEREVAAQFKLVFRVGIVGADLAVSETETHGEAVVKVVTCAQSACKVEPVDTPVSVQVAKIVGDAAPGAEFEATHLRGSKLICQDKSREQHPKSKLIHDQNERFRCSLNETKANAIRD